MSIDHVQQDTASFAFLAPYPAILLTTYRKNGALVPSPVWFATVGEKVFVVTSQASGKIKRLHNNASVLLAPCSNTGRVLGTEVAGRARILEPDDYEHARTVLERKYGFRFRAFEIFFRLRKVSRTYLEIVPV